MSEDRVKKIFFVAGELSGDRIAAWYLTKRFGACSQQELVCQGVGGNHMLNAGIELYARLEALNVTGIVEIIKHLPRLARMISDLVFYIKQHDFDEVVLVDFPGFNLRLAQRLKREISSITITYLSPPQVWCWGAWRVKKLARLCDQIVVMYPFEVAWYRQRGVTVQWLGSPVYDALKPYCDQQRERQAQIALLIGSRKQELQTLAPFFAQCLKSLAERYPEVTFVIPLAASIDDACLNQIFKQEGLCSYRSRIHVVRGEAAKFTQLQTCCCAISKPGTVTLELALLEIPTVIVYKTSWLTYAIARRLARVDKMGLPNLLTGKEIFPEFIQSECTVDAVTSRVGVVYEAFSGDTAGYRQMRQACGTVQNLLNAY